MEWSTAEMLLERLDGQIARITGVIPPVVLASRAACVAVRDPHAVADELGAQPLRVELETLARRARIELGQQPHHEAAPNAALEQLELTPREIEVLALLADGLTNREIGAELFISVKTASVGGVTHISAHHRTRQAAP